MLNDETLKNFSLLKENPLTGIHECHITTRCSKDSSRKNRHPRFEKNRGIRFQMMTIILRVAKSHHENQLQSIIQIKNLILWQTTEAKTSFRAMSKSKARSSSKKNYSSTVKSRGGVIFLWGFFDVVIWKLGAGG